MRIALLDSWDPRPHEGTGTAVGVRTLASALERLGHRVVPLAPAAAANLPARLWFNARLPGRIRAEGPFDLVVGVDIDGFRWAGRSAPRPGYVVMLKGVAADEASTEAGGARRRLRFLASLERRNARGASRVVVPSHYSADVAVRAYGLAAERVAVVPEGIDLGRWPGVELPGPAERTGSLTILSVARQYPRKDTATLLRAMPAVLARVPGARLRVIGGGPELVRLVALAHELGIGRAVHFDGALPDDAEVRRAYLEADVFCLPSLQEGFGIVFLEAMAAGLPVVAARAGAVPEVVAEGRTGLLVPPGDAPALARALVHLLETPDLRREFGARALERVRTFGLDAVAARFVEATLGTWEAAPAPATSAHTPATSAHTPATSA